MPSRQPSGFPATRLAAAVLALVLVPLAAAAPSPNARPHRLQVTAVTAPSGLQVAATTESSITIAWDASALPTTVGYGVYQDGILTASTTATSYTVNGLGCGKSYELGVDSVDVLGLRSAQSFVTASTKPCPDRTPPSVPQNQRITGKTATSITMAWDASTDNVAVTGYGVYRDGTRVATTTQTTYTYTGLTCGTTYTVALEAYDAAGNASDRSQATGPAATLACGDTSPPTAPTNLRSTGTTQTSISLAWAASADNVGVTGYGRYRNGTLIGNGTGTTYTHTGLTCGTSYSLSVDAYDAAGNRSTRATITASTSPCADTTPPTTPTNLVTTGQTATSISISWTGSIDNVGVAGYGVYRNGTKVTDTVATSHTVTGLTCGTAYTLAVDAFDAAANRSAKASITSSTSACAAPDTQPPSVPQNQRITGTTTTTVTMAWNASTDNVGVTGYAAWLNGSQIATTTQTTYTYTGLACGTTYTVGLEAYDAAGNRSDRALASGPATTQPCAGGDTTPPTTPTGLTSTSTTQTSIAVSWTASTDNVGVTGYGRYRDGSLVASGTGTTYTFSGLTCATSYALGVDAYDAAGNRSAQATITRATSACSPPPPPPPGSSAANLWVDTSGGGCVRQATPGAYSDAQACGSLQAAYNAASAGDTVNIVDGTYSGQVLASGTKTITFRAAGPGRPSFGHFTSAAQNITVRGVSIQDRSEQSASGVCSTAAWGVLTPCGQYQTYDNVIVDGLNTGSKHGIESPGRGFTLKNSEIRNIVNMKGFEGGADDMLIENNYWHDIRVTDSSVHNECMFINNGNRSIYRRNLFIGCPTMAMFFTNWNGGPAYRDVVIENNVLGHTLTAGGGWHPGPTLLVGSGYNNQNTLNGWTVRYNTFETGVLVDNLPGGGSQWYGNLGGIDCVSAFSYSYNVGQTCGGTGDVPVANATNTAGSPNQAPFYVNAPAGDFRLRAGSVPIDRADPSRYPATDKDGKTRPVGSRADAGAYEWG